MAMFGWLVRNQHEIPHGERLTQQYFFFSLATFVIIQTMFFGFEQNEIPVLGGGILLVMCMLMFFRPLTLAGTGEGIKGVLLAPVRFMGRYTLEIYVAHLLLFKALGAMIDPERFSLFDWKLVPEGMLEMAVSGVN
jgi:peptidoglycan/LPS O-acetylase OafA/YrhL